MDLSHTTISAVANIFSIEELQMNLKEATLKMIENPDQIVSASTGAGASYTKQLNMNAQELVELLSYALEYKQTGSISNGGHNIMSTVTYFPL